MKDIKGYEGLYAITPCGKVWSYKSKKFLSPILSQSGYQVVTLYKGKERKNVYIHRLVAEAYIPNPNGYDTVDHIDGNKSKNDINNLQWLKNADNNSKGHSKMVRCIETDEVFKSISAAAEKFGVNRHTISNKIKINASLNGLHFEFI